MKDEIKKIVDLIEKAECLSDEDKTSLVNEAKSIDKELTVTAFKLERTHKVKRTTEILLEETIEELEQKRKAVEKQNRELEIEASLERVRAIALSMKEPSDMLRVCHTISDQLELLEVKDIRNVQTAIFYEQRGTYMNYEYYTKHSKSIVTETTYTNNKVHNEFATKMLKGNGEYFITHIKGNDVKEWIAYQKTTNVFIDEYLKTASSLNYYWFSLGPVALGISTYEPLKEMEIELFKRFLKVFDLAYRRYMDIEKAEAQAKEAQIEAGLERVRTRAMAMNSTEDLTETANTFFSELIKLNINPHRCGFGIVDTETRTTDIHATTATQDNTSEVVTGKLKLSGHPVLDKIFEGFEKQEEYHPVLKGKEISEYYAVMNPQVKFPEFSEDEIQYGYYFYFKEGGAFAWTDKEFLESELEIFRKFSSVLSLTYRRYNDLKTAEAQAKEAKIEAALERVRSRSIGMQNSHELKDVIQVIYEQFARLDMNIEHTGFIIDYMDRDDMHIWLADEKGAPSEIYIPYFDSPHWNSFVDAKENGIDLFTNKLNFDEKNRFYEKLFKFIPDLPDDAREFYIGCPGLAISTVLLDNVGLYAENFSGIPFSDEDNSVLMRFGKTFQQTYTRFLDLKKVEEQAREAQIEMSLEKVRNVALSLKKSDEMLDIAKVLYEQLVELGFTNIRNAIIDIKNGDDDTFTDYDYSSEMSGTITQMSYHDDPTLEGQFKKMATTTNDFFELVLEGKELEDLKAMRIKNGEDEDPRLLNIDVLTYNLYSFGNGAIGISNFGVLIEEEKSILRRFSNVFTFAYKRYSDLVQAENQAREAEIEVALERVRSRTMAMHKSNELAQTAAHLFTQLNELRIKPYRCNIAIVNDQSESIQLWSTTNSGNVIPTSSFIPLTKYSVLREMYEGWKSQKDKHIFELKGEDRLAWTKYLSKYVPFKEYKPENIDEDILLNETAVFSNCYFKQGYFTIHTKEELSNDEYNIIKRFSNVFEQTYTRFLDLERAEEQNRLIKAENERKTQELEEARQLQLAMLPKNIPQLPHLDIAVYMQTATEVGGDYYDFHVEDDETLTAVIGDATGHGMKAGTMVTITKSLFNTLASSKDIIKTFQRISRVIKDMKFRQLSMCLQIVKIKNGKILISSAAMPPTFIYRKNKKSVDEIMLSGMPLGAMMNFPYKIDEREINKGDVILMLSDGLPELTNNEGIMYDYDRIKKDLIKVAPYTPNDIIDYFKFSAEKWLDGKEADDDLTFVVIKVK